ARRAAARPDVGRNALRQRPHIHVPGAVARARAGACADHRRLCSERFRRRAAGSARSAHARQPLRGGIAMLKLALSISLALACGAAIGQDTKPQYGGTLKITTYFPTLSALSWDPQEWHWKLNQDTGMYFEQLFAGDLDKSVRKGGKHKFILDAWLPSDAMRGELAESWDWEDPLTVVIRLR